MKKRYLVEMANCPRCKAICLVGHDEDGQIFCAKCGNSFRPDKTIKMDEKEYEEMLANKVKMKHESGGWTAYTIS